MPSCRRARTAVTPSSWRRSTPSLAGSVSTTNETPRELLLRLGTGGVGRPLFGLLQREVGLQHVTTRVFDFGFVPHQYRIA